MSAFNAGEIRPDTAASPCAACGMPATAVEGQRAARRSVGGKLIMLCIDAAACCKRYRRGLSPAGYGTMVKRGDMP